MKKKGEITKNFDFSNKYLDRKTIGISNLIAHSNKSRIKNMLKIIRC